MSYTFLMKPFLHMGGSMICLLGLIGSPLLFIGPSLISFSNIFIWDFDNEYTSYTSN